MKLSNLLKNVEVKEIIGETDVDIKSLCQSDSEAKIGSLYFCINGTQTDGHDYAKRAVNKGAVAIVCERRIDIKAVQIIVSSTRKAMSIIASNFYGNACSKLKIIGVTGTNGKTTTCHVIRNVLAHAGYEVGLIGTLGIFYKNVEIAPELTTPDPIYLHKIFAKMVEAGVEYAVMEVSAHAMELDKLLGIRFAVGVFTNLTQDHLDFFGDMKKYSLAKQKFLTKEYCDFLIFNTDDELGRKLFLSADRKSASFGINDPSDVFAINVKESLSGIEFVMNLFDNIYNVKCRMAGLFSVYNCLSAATCCAVLGVDFDDIVAGIENTEGVKGRIELVKSADGRQIFIDYAHTPDGLKNVITALRKCVKGRLLCLFGCGGNRDKSKRSKMGEIAGELADFCIITSDNPRYEEPFEIISDVEKGLRKKTDKYITIQDRASAINYAVSKMSCDDVLLIAGKGAEEYQEIMGVKHHFSDKKFVESLIGGSKD